MKRCEVGGRWSGRLDPACDGQDRQREAEKAIRDGVERRGERVHCVHCDADVTDRFLPEVWEQVGVPPEKFPTYVVVEDLRAGDVVRIVPGARIMRASP